MLIENASWQAFSKKSYFVSYFFNKKILKDMRNLKYYSYICSGFQRFVCFLMQH